MSLSNDLSCMLEGSAATQMVTGWSVGNVGPRPLVHLDIKNRWASRQSFYPTLLLRPESAQEKVQVGKDQEKAQSEKDSHSQNQGGKKTELTIRYLYHETYRKPNEQLFSQ